MPYQQYYRTNNLWICEFCRNPEKRLNSRKSVNSKAREDSNWQKIEYSCPPANARLSAQQAIYGMEDFHCPAWVVWLLCSPPAPAHRPNMGLDKVLDFLTTENISVFSILLMLLGGKLTLSHPKPGQLCTNFSHVAREHLTHLDPRSS